MNQCRLTGAQSADRKERIVRGGKHLNRGAGFDITESIRDGYDLAFMRDHVLRLRATGDQPHHALPHAQLPDVLTDRFDDTRELEAQASRIGAGRGRVSPLALHEIGTIEAGCSYANQHVARTWCGLWNVKD